MSFFKNAFSGCMIILSGAVGSFGVYNQFIVTKELVCHFYGNIEVSAAVTGKIKNQVLYMFIFEFSYGRSKLIHGGKRETVDLNITGIIIYFITCINTVNRNFIPVYFIFNQFRMVFSHYREVHS